MDKYFKYLLIIASLITVKVTESKDEEKKKIKVERPYHHYPLYTNICDIVDRTSKVHCYCDSNKPKMATWADCWVFSGGITEDDPIWPSFSSQSLLEDLTFNVRFDEALTFVPAKAIVRLDNLKHLTIQFGTIKTIHPYAFTNSSTLKQITLKSNKIMHLQRHAFAQMMMLTNLSLDDNQITELRRDVFFNLPNLHVLHISNNNLSLVHEGSFKHLNNLLELKLDFNYISVVTKETFSGLENLTKLDLRSNKLTMIGNLAFSELWGLKELLLDNNSIEYISERSFGGLKHLKKLSLANNKLTAFFEDILEEVRGLVVLDLKENLLDTISYETLRPVLENKKSSARAVYLEGNPLNCDCRLSWIYRYILRNETGRGALRNALERITCITDNDLMKRLNKDKNLRKEDKKTVNVITNDNYDYYEEKGEVLYDQPNQRLSETQGKVNLIDLPLELLPCPNELMQSMEQSYSHPIQNEIRLKSLGKSYRHCIELTFIPLVLLL